MIRLENVWFSYRLGEWVLAGLHLEIPDGLTLVVGPNGAGKSTFLKLVSGIERPDRGRVVIDDNDLWQDEVAARRGIAYVPEQPDLTPYATILDILRLVCRVRGAEVVLAREILQRAGLGGLGKRSIRELSMGQRRRAVLAAAWIGSPRILVLDEPLEAMDRSMRENIIRWVTDRLIGGAGVLVATHDIEPFAPLAARALAFRDGSCALVETLPADAPSRVAALEPYTR